MKILLVIAICVLSFASCGSTARCGLAQTNKIEKISISIEANQADMETLEASAE